MRKGLFLLVSLFIAGGVAKADIPDKKIVVKSRSGSAEYAIADIVSIKFGTGDVFINMSDGTTASWDTGSINAMSLVYCEPSPDTGIEETRLLPFSFSDGMLTVVSDVPVPVSLSTMDGKLLFGGSCCGELRLPVGNRPAGVYVLNVGGVIYKIMNR